MTELILNTKQPFIQAVIDCEVPRMAFGRICILGDAAFAARPHTAAGTLSDLLTQASLGNAIILMACANQNPFCAIKMMALPVLLS